ncbi:MAG: RsmD family RNA methyltransferase [Terriglobales bacterium]
MRVVGGEWRSRRLRGPGTIALRPTSDRLRESLFDILGPTIAGRGFVDAYAGTGAVGIEAFSRGARPVVWIEASPAAARLLRANLASLGALDDPQALVLQQPLPRALTALAALAPLRAAGGAALLFLDPPYDDAAALEQCLRALERHPEALAPDARVLTEVRASTAVPQHVGRWVLARLHRQGDSQLAFFAGKD